MIKEAIFTYEEFMEKLGLEGDFEAMRNIVCSTQEPSPRVEVVYHSSKPSTITEVEE